MQVSEMNSARTQVRRFSGLVTSSEQTCDTTGRQTVYSIQAANRLAHSIVNTFMILFKAPFSGLNSRELNLLASAIAMGRVDNGHWPLFAPSPSSIDAQVSRTTKTTTNWVCSNEYRIMLLQLQIQQHQENNKQELLSLYLFIHLHLVA